ncbi:bile acid:sodium symporter [Sulfuricystis thermophila]|uniref:bile acid:sodium symporter n=1 Tax=Sulfuricystis thermophila TaxID=2496847 RepID=UPI001558634C|nr:bile acid:sodium symporter [Sulfuricystis thermophila]
MLSLFYNFVLTPVIAWFLVQGMAGSPELALGFYLVMLIPGSSMAIAYTGMAGGSLELATVAQAAGFLVAPLMLPLFILKTSVTRSHLHDQAASGVSEAARWPRGCV